MAGAAPSAEEGGVKRAQVGRCGREKKTHNTRMAGPARRNFTRVVSGAADGGWRGHAADAIINLKGAGADMKNLKQAGFTLIELALVLAAVSGFAAIVLPAVQ